MVRASKNERRSRQASVHPRSRLFILQSLSWLKWQIQPLRPTVHAEKQLCPSLHARDSASRLSGLWPATARLGNSILRSSYSRWDVKSSSDGRLQRAEPEQSSLQIRLNVWAILFAKLDNKTTPMMAEPGLTAADMYMNLPRTQVTLDCDGRTLSKRKDDDEEALDGVLVP